MTYQKMPDEISLFRCEGDIKWSEDSTDALTTYVNKDLYTAVCAERDALRALCEGMAGKLRMIGEGKPENPCGDPWAFYNDLVVLAREALTDYEKHKGVGDGFIPRN